MQYIHTSRIVGSGLHYAQKCICDSLLYSSVSTVQISVLRVTDMSRTVISFIYNSKDGFLNRICLADLTAVLAVIQNTKFNNDLKIVNVGNLVWYKEN